MELLAAGGALERPHLVVDPHVNIQPRFLVESFGAHGAGEIIQIGIVLVVHVRFEEVARRERAAAVLAQVGLLSFVISLDKTNETVTFLDVFLFQTVNAL